MGFVVVCFFRSSSSFLEQFNFLFKKNMNLTDAFHYLAEIELIRFSQHPEAE